MKKIIIILVAIVSIVVFYKLSVHSACDCNCGAATYGYRSYITGTMRPSLTVKEQNSQNTGMKTTPCSCPCKKVYRFPIEAGVGLLVVLAVCSILFFKKQRKELK